MEQIVIQLNDVSKKDFLIALLKELAFVEVLNLSSKVNGTTGTEAKLGKRLNLSPKKRALVEDIKEALREVELHEQGKIKLQTWQEFMEEWKTETNATPD
jgi:hypothetical protein